MKRNSFSYLEVVLLVSTAGIIPQKHAIIVFYHFLFILQKIFFFHFHFQIPVELFLVLIPYPVYDLPFLLNHFHSLNLSLFPVRVS